MQAEDYFADDLQVRFVEAVAKGNEKRMREYLQQGVDVNAVGRQGMRPLFWAFVKRSPKGVRFLLENGADPNIRAQTNPEDESTISPIELAAIAEDCEYLRLLLKHGANPNTALSYGDRTVIGGAVMNNRMGNVRILIEAGADLNHQDISGSTVMITAAGINKFDMVYLFLQKGADPKIKDRWGYDLAGMISEFGDSGVQRGSEQHRWYFKVVEELRARGLID